MALVRLKGLNRTRKRLANGRIATYYYAWKGGPRLPGNPGSPKFVDAYGNWGTMLREQGKYDAAIEKFRQAVDLDPNYANGYHGWGLVLYVKHDYPAAI